jgi:hypothetical protein
MSPASERESIVRFDLAPFLGYGYGYFYRVIRPGEAYLSMPVRVRACVRERYSGLRFAMPKPPSSCASFTVYPPLDGEAVWGHDEVDPWDPRGVFIEDPPLTWEQPIAVRLTMRDQAGNSVFDSSAVVQPERHVLNCDLYCDCKPGQYQAHVVAMPNGSLIPD